MSIQRIEREPSFLVHNQINQLSSASLALPKLLKATGFRRERACAADSINVITESAAQARREPVFNSMQLSDILAGLE